MALTEQQIRQITDEIVRSLTQSMKVDAPAAPASTGCTGRWLCDTAEEAVANAKAAQAQLAEMTLEKRSELIAAMRKAGIDNAEYLAIQRNELSNVEKLLPFVESDPRQGFHPEARAYFFDTQRLNNKIAKLKDLLK